jgi:hypothetical protein
MFTDVRPCGAYGHTSVDGSEYYALFANGTILPAEGSGVDDAVQRLVRAYAPVFILRPRGVNGAEAPFPGGKHDYHPESVDAYLSEARLLNIEQGSPSRWLIKVAFLAGTLLFGVLVGAIGIAIRIFRDWQGVSADAVMLVAVFFALTGWTLPVVIGGVRGREAIADRLRIALRLRPPDAGFAGRDRILTTASFLQSIRGLARIKHPALNLQADAGKVWARYCSRSSGDIQSPSVYLRVVRDDGLSAITLQFWIFYLYNDWWDTHESDWEVVSLFFADQASNEPIAAAYSTHLNCRWRSWETVAKAPGAFGSHPLVYVAAGSHANYFGPSDEGYSVPWNLPQVILDAAWAFRSASGASFRDYVAPVLGAEIVVGANEDDGYRIIEMPALVESVDPAGPRDRWQRWWWLRYEGMWGSSLPGAVSFIPGPPMQRLRWDSPYKWVLEKGEPDSDDSTKEWPGLFR